MNNGISVKLRIIENTTIKAQLMRWNWDSHKQRDQPAWAGLAEERHETPAKNWKSARASVGVHYFFLPPSKLFVNFAKVEDVCTCMNFSPCHCTCDLGQKKLVVIRLWLGRRSWLSEKSRREVKHLPELQKGKIRQKSKAKGEWEKWQAQGIKINTQT